MNFDFILGCALYAAEVCRSRLRFDYGFSVAEQQGAAGGGCVLFFGFGAAGRREEELRFWFFFFCCSPVFLFSVELLCKGKKLRLDKTCRVRELISLGVSFGCCN